MGKLGIVFVTLCVAAVVGMAYLVLTTPTCEELGGRTVQNGWTLMPVFTNNTLLMLPQPLYECEGATR